MVLLGLTLFALYGQSPYVILFATGVTMFSLPAAWALIIDIPAVLVIVAVLLVNGKFSGSLGNLIAVCSITLTMFFMARLVHAVRRLQQANWEIATLAVTAERERMARDLHDILGHSSPPSPSRRALPGECWKAQAISIERSPKSGR
jgi:two-component system sensor histidine kinase DesK